MPANVELPVYIATATDGVSVVQSAPFPTAPQALRGVLADARTRLVFEIQMIQLLGLIEQAGHINTTLVYGSLALFEKSLEE